MSISNSNPKLDNENKIMDLIVEYGVPENHYRF